MPPLCLRLKYGYYCGLWLVACFGVSLSPGFLASWRCFPGLRCRCSSWRGSLFQALRVALPLWLCYRPSLCCALRRCFPLYIRAYYIIIMPINIYILPRVRCSDAVPRVGFLAFCVVFPWAFVALVPLRAVVPVLFAMLSPCVAPVLTVFFVALAVM